MSTTISATGFDSSKQYVLYTGKVHTLAVQQNNTNSATILIVEDYELLREIVMDYLQLMGFTVIGAENGRVALQVLATQHIDLVVTDMQMPVLDGLSTLAEIRKSSSIPVIMVSGSDYEPLYDRLKQLSLTAFLSKPVDLWNLSKSIHNILEGRVSFSLPQVVSDNTQYL